jgi:ABC-type multidrug transport system permease subunit
MKRPIVTTFSQKLFSFFTVIVLLIVIGAVTYFGLGWIKAIAGAGAFYIIIALLIAAYLFLLWVACKVPDL